MSSSSRQSRLASLNLVAVLSLVLLGCLLASPIGERLFGRERLRFPYLTRPLAREAYEKLAAEAGWSRTQLEVASGVKLNGLLRRPTRPDASWILFFPGNAEAQLRMGQKFLSRTFEDRAWGLATFAYRGFDSSEGAPDHAALSEDAPRILQRLCDREGIAPVRVHLIGFSIGGHFAAHAARGAAKSGRRAASLTLLASVDDIVMVRESPWMALSSGDDYQTRPLLVDVPGPVLVVQGDADEALAGPGQGRAIAAALGAKATYHELHGVRHEALLADETAIRLTRDFIASATK